MIDQQQLLAALQQLAIGRHQQDGQPGLGASIMQPLEMLPYDQSAAKGSGIMNQLNSFMTPSMPWQNPTNIGDFLGQQFNSQQYQVDPSQNSGGIMNFIRSLL